jgi:peptide/nickel transport system substrate-binding protein
MLRNRLFVLLGLLVITSMVLAACGTPAPAVDETAEAPTEGATEVVTAEPTPEPTTRQGAWVDEVVFSEQGDEAAAVAQLQAGDIDVYADGIADPNLFQAVQADPNLTYSTSFGLYFELYFNPVQTFADGRLNPFGSKVIREATNMLIDRDYIVQEIFGGLGNPKYTSLNGAFPDYARYIDSLREIENKYAFNVEKADAAITAEMEALGATKNADGKWEFNGAPVTIIFIIRTEDQRTPIADYVSNQLESIGFTVDRQYKSRSEASPIWAGSEPTEGQWNVYTGGWISTAISRDDGTNFGFFDTDFGGCCGLGSTLFTAEYLGQEYYDVSTALWNNDFATLEEREELFKQALPLHLQNSIHVWVVDTQSFFPRAANISVASDLAGGTSGSALWPYTLRIGDTEGGTVRIAQQDNFIDPWNPVAGSNWISDQMPIRSTGDFASIPDPYTGLALPQRAESLTVVAKEGLPIATTLDWVSLSFAPEVAVPADAWANWDATTQTFTPAGDGVTANVKITWTYPADLFATNSWHDGSPLSVGDFVMGMIMTFDRGKAESGLYDEGYVPGLDAFLASFKGVQIESTDPLVISTYTDAYALDAETFGFSWYPANSITYTQGPGAWHNLTPSILAESAGELAFSQEKAAAAEVEWVNFIAGPTLEIQKKYLDQAAAEGYIPFAATMGQYVTAEEAAARYANLDAWYADKGHFWIGTGPMILDQVFTVEGNIVLTRNENFPDLADKWAGFSEPRIAVVDVSGAGQVTAGQEAVFDVTITFNGEAYPADDLVSVKYLVFDSNNQLVATGEADFVADGQYTVTLPADLTGGFDAGSNKIEVAVASKVVSIPSFGSFEFVTVK